MVVQSRINRFLFFTIPQLKNRGLVFCLIIYNRSNQLSIRRKSPFISVVQDASLRRRRNLTPVSNLTRSLVSSTVVSFAAVVWGTTSAAQASKMRLTQSSLARIIS